MTSGTVLCVDQSFLDYAGWWVAVAAPGGWGGARARSLRAAVAAPTALRPPVLSRLPTLATLPARRGPADLVGHAFNSLGTDPQQLDEWVAAAGLPGRCAAPACRPLPQLATTDAHAITNPAPPRPGCWRSPSAPARRSWRRAQRNSRRASATSMARLWACASRSPWAVSCSRAAPHCWSLAGCCTGVLPDCEHLGQLVDSAGELAETWRCVPLPQAPIRSGCWWPRCGG
jgi:hypothetical protein